MTACRALKTAKRGLHGLEEDHMTIGHSLLISAVGSRGLGLSLPIGREPVVIHGGSCRGHSYLLQDWAGGCDGSSRGWCRGVSQGLDRGLRCGLRCLNRHGGLLLGFRRVRLRQGRGATWRRVGLAVVVSTEF